MITRKVIKIRMHDIILNNKQYDLMLDACTRANNILFYVYQFIRLFILHKYEKKETIPLIDENFVKICFKILSKSSAGPKNKNYSIIDELEIFCKNNCLFLLHSFDSKNLSSVIDYLITSVVTNINNNILLNYEKYVNRFVNSFYKNKQTKISFIELKKLKEDLVLNKCSNIKFQEWFDKHRNNMFDESFINYNEIINPQLFLKNMIYMNNVLELNTSKQFQFFPLKKSFDLNHIIIDTKSLIEICDLSKNKNEYLKNITEQKNEIWKEVFNMNHKIFKMNKPKTNEQKIDKQNVVNGTKYNFDYIIQTDCTSVSLIFIEQSEQIKSEKKKAKMKVAKVEAKELLRDKTTEEKQKIKEDKAKNKIDKQNEQKLNDIKKKKEHIVKIKNKEVTTKTEFQYITVLDEKTISDNYVVIDPGKKSLLKILGKNGVKMSYSYARRKKEIKTEYFNKKIRKIKKKIKEKIETEINKLEIALTKNSCKTVNKIKFMEYIKDIYEIKDKITEEQIKSKCNVYKWYRFLNEKRSIDNLVNEIKEKYGEDVIIFIGDWSEGNSQLKNSPSTPRIGLKRKLNKYFKVYNLDEYNTSKKNCYTEKDNTNMCVKIYNKKSELYKTCITETQDEIKKMKDEYIKKHPKIIRDDVKYKKLDMEIEKRKNEINKNHIKIKYNEILKNKIKEKQIGKEEIKLHSVLTYKMERKNTVGKKEILGCINRDNNSCKNMIKIVEEYKTTKTRPIYLERPNKIIVCN